MEISFITDDRFRKLNMIFKLFGAGVLPQAAKEFPAFFGKEMYLSSRIFDGSIFIHGYQSVWDACFDANPSAKLEEIAPNVVSMLDALDIPLVDQKDGFFDELKMAIASGFSTNEKAIAEAFKSIFKFELPQKLVLIIDGYNPRSYSFGHKLAVNSDTGVIGYCMGSNVLKKDKKEPISVILHELVHVLFSRYKTIKRTAGSNAYEEALIRYFAPYGVLTEKLNFYPHDEIRHYLEQIKDLKSFPASDKLFVVMKEYSEMPEGTDIWGFLSKKGFGEYLDAENIGLIG